MIRALSSLRRLRRDSGGVTMIEFALLAPMLIGMIMGVFQIGTGMKAYNALRGASADLARYAVVNYQTSNKLTDTQLASYGRSLGTNSQYQLTNGRLLVFVSTPTTQRVDGATEKTITMIYTVRSVLQIIGIDDIQITYTRPVFLI